MKKMIHGVPASALTVLVMAGLLITNLANIATAAAPGAFDSTFDTDGIATTDANGSDRTNDVAVQPDGKIVVAGRSNVGGGGAAFDFCVVRFNADGSLDPTFGTNGIVTTDFGNVDSANGVAIQTDGKIVVVGESDPVGSGLSDVAVARYLANGSLDSSFDTDGKVLTDFAASNDNAVAVAIQLDGKIVVGGGSAGDFAAARYNTNGTLDTSFSTDGKQTVDFGATAIMNSMVLQPDGKVLLAGAGNDDFALARINTNGTPDVTFNSDGQTTTDISQGDTANSIALQADGKIVAAGTADGNNQCALARYTPNGALDTSFDGDGKVITNFNSASTDIIEDIAIQANGRIVALVDANQTLGMLRYFPNGTIDNSFGNGGSISPHFTYTPNAMDLAADGKIVVAGSNASDMATIRLNTTVQPTETADFDGDGTSDFSVFRPSNGTWFILNSSTNTATQQVFGQNGDIPIDGDFDGDARSDIAVWRPSSGTWFFIRSSNGTTGGAPWGATGDKPVPGDYDKDGKTDFAVWRPSDGINYIVRSSTSSFFGVQWGVAGDIPLMGAGQ